MNNADVSHLDTAVDGTPEQWNSMSDTNDAIVDVIDAVLCAVTRPAHSTSRRS